MALRTPTLPPLVLPDGGAPLSSGPALFRGHPLHRRAEVALPGVRLEVRPVQPQDAAAVATFVERLSDITRYRRFHAPLRRPTAAQLAGIVDVDHHDRETLLALLPGRRGTIVALAQYLRIEPDVADMAVVVADRWQRQGIGSALVAQLAEAAREEGIRRFAATVLADNPAPTRLARTLSPALEATGHGTTIDLRIPLGA
jgi:GNAT superfamily N-acetyltransferase